MSAPTITATAPPQIDSDWDRLSSAGSDTTFCDSAPEDSTLAPSVADSCDSLPSLVADPIVIGTFSPNEDTPSLAEVPHAQAPTDEDDYSEDEEQIIMDASEYADVTARLSLNATLLSQKDTEIKNKDAEIAGLTKHLEIRKTFLVQRETEIASLQLTTEDAHARTARYKADRAYLDHCYDGIKKRYARGVQIIQEANSRIRVLTAQLDNSAELVQTERGYREQLSAEVTTLLSRIRDLEAENEKVGRQRDAGRVIAAEQAEQLAGLYAERESARQRVRVVEREWKVEVCDRKLWASRAKEVGAQLAAVRAEALAREVEVEEKKRSVSERVERLSGVIGEMEKVLQGMGGLIRGDADAGEDVQSSSSKKEREEEQEDGSNDMPEPQVSELSGSVVPASSLALRFPRSDAEIPHQETLNIDRFWFSAGLRGRQLAALEELRARQERADRIKKSLPKTLDELLQPLDETNKELRQDENSAVIEEKKEKEKEKAQEVEAGDTLPTSLVPPEQKQTSHTGVKAVGKAKVTLRKQVFARMNEVAETPEKDVSEKDTKEEKKRDKMIRIARGLLPRSKLEVFLYVVEWFVVNAICKWVHEYWLRR